MGWRCFAPSSQPWTENKDMDKRTLSGVIDRIGPITRCDGRIVMLIRIEGDPTVHRLPEMLYEGFEAVALSRPGDRIEMTVSERSISDFTNVDSSMTATTAEFDFI